MKEQGFAMQSTEPEKRQEGGNPEEYEASMQQESLYFNEMLHPKGAEYLIHYSAEIQGGKDLLLSFSSVGSCSIHTKP